MKMFFIAILCIFDVLLGNAQGLECGWRSVFCFDLDVSGYNPYLDPKYQNINDAGFEKEANKEREIWRGLHLATTGYKSNYILSSDNTSNRVSFNMAPNNYNPWLFKQCYGNSSQNYSFFYGDGEITASYIQQPPNADRIDYIIYGNVLNNKTGTYNLEIKGINFRENEILFTRFVNFDNYIDAYNQGKQVSANGASLFENTILPDYEKNKRNKANEVENGLVAIEPKFEFDEQSYDINNESIYDAVQKITVTLTDCDGVPLKNKELAVEVNKGTIIDKTIKTDSDGEAVITYLAPDNSCTDEITAIWEFNYPSGRHNTIKASAIINVKAPITLIDAQITINQKYVTFRPSELEQRESTSQNWVINGKLKCTIVRERIQKYIDDPSTRSECGPGTHCPIVIGASNYTVLDPKNILKPKIDERYPLYVGTDYEAKGYRYVADRDQYVVTARSNAEGANTFEALSLEINSYIPLNGLPASSTPQYVIWLSGGIYFDKASMVPEGNGSNMYWDEYENKLTTGGGSHIIRIPYNFSGPEHSLNENEIYEPLLITNSKAFEEYLLNPVGAFTIQASGKRFAKDESMQSQGYITVKIVINPVPEKKNPE